MGESKVTSIQQERRWQMGNSSALRIKGADLLQGMRVFPCNRKGEPLEQTKEGKPRMVYRVLYIPNRKQLALYPYGSSRINILMSHGVGLDAEKWFAPIESFSLQDFPKSAQDTRVVVFLGEGLVHDPEHQDDILELLACSNGNGVKFLREGKEHAIPEGAILIPTGIIG
jgi:hypothetical protein